MIFPNKLVKGDKIRVIAPAKSFRSTFTPAMRQTAIQRLENLGLQVTFGKYVDEVDEFDSTTVEHRLEDLHSAFADPAIKVILTVLGGAQSNQLLKSIDYPLIKKNPKILCGMSDITALANAIYTLTGLVTYSGPHFTLFRDSPTVEYTTRYFAKTFFSDEVIDITPCESYADKRSDSELLKNEGFWILNEGKAEARLLGGNLITFAMLQGSRFAPDISDSILFFEDNDKENFRAFENHLQAVINQPNFDAVKGLVIGRFQKASLMTNKLLTSIVKKRKELDNIPIIANVDFGHTVPMVTLPIGGTVQLDTSITPFLRIIKH